MHVVSQCQNNLLILCNCIIIIALFLLQVVRRFYKTAVPFTRKVYCAQKDREFCAIQFPEILNSNVSYIIMYMEMSDVR